MNDQVNATVAGPEFSEAVREMANDIVYNRPRDESEAKLVKLVDSHTKMVLDAFKDGTQKGIDHLNAELHRLKQDSNTRPDPLSPEDEAKRVASIAAYIKSDHPSIANYLPMDPEQWAEKGRPHLWRLAETYDDIEVWLDTGYGRLALVVGGECVSWGKDFLTHARCVVMDTEYYGVPKFIWR